MKLSYHLRVQAEVNEAVDWYEEQSPGLGDDFFTKLKEALVQIAGRVVDYLQPDVVFLAEQDRSRISATSPHGKHADL